MRAGLFCVQIRHNFILFREEKFLFSCNKPEMLPQMSISGNLQWWLQTFVSAQYCKRLLCFVCMENRTENYEIITPVLTGKRAGPGAGPGFCHEDRAGPRAGPRSPHRYGIPGFGAPERGPGRSLRDTHTHTMVVKGLHTYYRCTTIYDTCTYTTTKAERTTTITTTTTTQLLLFQQQQ